MTIETVALSMILAPKADRFYRAPQGGMQCQIPSSAHATALSLDNKAFSFSFIVSKRGGLGGL
jgi:hypothetical protein